MDGVLIVNKPKGCTSNDVVNKIKHLLNCKVGHTGTLDPNATGVLPLLLGKGTKFSKYLINHDKKYCATLSLGTKTTTADVEGEIVEECEVKEEIFNESKLNEILRTFIGKQVQVPPIYSAIKVNGKKLYDYARKGFDVEVPSRQIEIYDIELVDFDKKEKMVVFNVECSKGTYIRTLCEDIACKLQTVGYMKELERLKVGEFRIEKSVMVKDVEDNLCNEQWIEKNIITLESILHEKEKIFVEENRIDKFLNGVKIPVPYEDGVYKVYHINKFIGSGVVKNNLLKRDVII